MTSLSKMLNGQKTPEEYNRTVRNPYLFDRWWIIYLHKQQCLPREHLDREWEPEDLAKIDVNPVDCDETE